jgi:hypothetical protein
VDNLRENNSVSLRFSYTNTRNPLNHDDSEDITAVATCKNEINVDDQLTRHELIEIFKGTSDSPTKAYVISFVLMFCKFLFGYSQFTILNLIPRFVHVKPRGKP